MQYAVLFSSPDKLVISIHAYFSFSVGRINGAFALSSGKETICRDVEAARILFRQMDEHLSKLETKVSMLL